LNSLIRLVLLSGAILLIMPGLTGDITGAILITGAVAYCWNKARQAEALNIQQTQG
jgi:UPF0716 family protein affecting phage T7 exclusion